MDPKLIGLLVLMMLCCCSSVSAFFMIPSGDPATGPSGGGGGDDEDSDDDDDEPYQGYVSGRYVRLALPVATPSKYVLALHDIRVYDENGENIATTAKGASVSASGSNSGSPEDAIDGERYSTFWISNHSDGLRYFEIDLGSTKKITKIEMYDATGGDVYNGVVANQRMRLGEAYIEIKDASDARVVKSAPIPHDGGRYYLNMEDTPPTW
jgi:hypothetical protein